MSKLTWLHISDIHFHPGKEWRDCVSRSSLIKHLSGIFSSNPALRPDLIFCTGDIAFGELSSCDLEVQYQQAKEFFEKLLSISGTKGNPLPRERLFVVPGNHDVARSKINRDAQSTLNDWARRSAEHTEEINQRFADRPLEFDGAMSRLDDYAKFIQEFLPHQHFGDRRHCYTSVTNINGIQVGIAGFNSGWTCAGPEDDRNIWLAADWQFNAAVEGLRDADIRIGLMHHPIDWLNSTERELAIRRLASDFDFWLHGHSHDAWVTPVQTHVVIAAGAVGASSSEEFGVNLVTMDLSEGKGTVHLHSKRAGTSGWTIAPIEPHAPLGLWPFSLPDKLREFQKKKNGTPPAHQPQAHKAELEEQGTTFIDRYLSHRFQNALQSFSAQPNVWISPTVCTKSELTKDVKSVPRVDLDELIANPRSVVIRAPAQYGQTSLCHFLVLEAWRAQPKGYWLYLNAIDLKPNLSSITDAMNHELSILGLTRSDIRCVVLDSWSATEKDGYKLLNRVSRVFENIPLICMERVEVGNFRQTQNPELPRELEVLYLWSLRREDIRRIVAAYNEIRHIGDEDAVTTRLASDLDVLNLHRTPLNCLTLLKVSEIEFDESPVNRSEVIKRVLFLLFNVDDIPTYKSRPDLKDCEFVLGYFCEQLIRDGSNQFARDKFLALTQRFCRDALIDLETDVVFDVLVKNNVLIKRGSFFAFKFSYWIFYFAAQRMHHDPAFAQYIFEGMRYAQHPELIEFYTGIDRKREDALRILIRDLRECRESVQRHSGLPEEFNPYEKARWNPSPEAEEEMQKVIAEGVHDSSLPASIKDEFADRSYDQSRPYNQEIANLLNEHTFSSMMRTMTAGARALRNSDYVSPAIKRELLQEILGCWEQASRILLIVLPALAADGRAIYDGAGFYLAHDFGDTPQERFVRILCAIPSNIVSWSQDDLFSKKMGPLLIDQLENPKLGRIARHELMLLLIEQRPRNWGKAVQGYIVETKKNSYYLHDTNESLMHVYKYGFLAPVTRKEVENLIRMAAAKHLTGTKEPNAAQRARVQLPTDLFPSSSEEE